MSRATIWTAAATVTLVASAGLTWAGPASAMDYDDDGYCAGMSAPALTTPGNRAPTPVNDVARSVAGGSITIKVLANDTDPDRNALFVEGTSRPKRGDVCVDSNGELEYDAPASSTDYVDTFTYGVTDGDYYRTATVQVQVTGVKPLRAALQHRLTFKKGSHTKVKKAAVVGFTNPNNRSLLVLAGDPDKRRAELQTVVGAGKTVALKTKAKKILIIAGLKDSAGNLVIVEIGSLNTVNGKQSLITGEGNASSGGSDVLAGRAQARRWLRR